MLNFFPNCNRKTNYNYKDKLNKRRDYRGITGTRERLGQYFEKGRTCKCVWSIMLHDCLIRTLSVTCALEPWKVNTEHRTANVVQLVILRGSSQRLHTRIEKELVESYGLPLVPARKLGLADVWYCFQSKMLNWTQLPKLACSTRKFGSSLTRIYSWADLSSAS